MHGMLNTLMNIMQKNQRGCSPAAHFLLSGEFNRGEVYGVKGGRTWKIM
jgi:hypothetical protein